MKQSALDWLGLPANFGYALLIIGLVLTLAPYLRGSDFGVFKIPDFDPSVRSALRLFGPVVMLVAVLMHVKSLPEAETVKTVVAVSSSATGSADKESAAREPVVMPVGSLASDDVVLARWNGGICLYLARVVEADGAKALVRFAFSGEAQVPVADLIRRPQAAPAGLEYGDRVFTYLRAADGWAPGTIREIRDGRVRIDLDPAAECAQDQAKDYIWSKSNETMLATQGDM